MFMGSLHFINPAIESFAASGEESDPERLNERERMSKHIMNQPVSPSSAKVQD